MKRLFSFILALALVFSLSVTAFANEGTGSITITNATKGDTYKLYKIFEASYLPDGSDEGTEVDGVSYTLTDADIFAYMFGSIDEPAEGVTVDEENGTRSNALFTYTDATKLIERNKDTDEEDIFKYLTDMIRELDADGTKVLKVAEDVTSDTVIFDDLAYGYYLIDKDLTGLTAEQVAKVAVTITSNTPVVNVIDKNQKPATNFDKLIWDEDYDNGDGTFGKWVPNASANIGDIVEFKVEFDATNYDGEEQIQYYTVMDTKGSAQWVEFNGITVVVDGKPLTQGYYHATEPSNPEENHKTGEWEYLGTWTDENGAPVEKSPENAQWYLIHYGFDQFEIVIPWMSDYTFNGTTNGYTLTFGENAESMYDSPVSVVLNYTASVEPGADIGNPTNNNLWNKAELSWNDTTRPGSSTTTTEVYAMGLHKVDASNNASLADAEFGLYRDEACTQPVYVIPTDVKGVYILDDLYTFVSGDERDTSREKYAAYLEEYLDGEVQKNVVTTQTNGKLVILGLEAGDYYLKETKAPDGYNILSKPEKVTVGDTTNTVTMVVDADGNVVTGTQVEEGYKKYTYTATEVTVKNSKGVQLPSTGGAGTMMMITIGTMMAIAFAVLLITQKKMSVYQD